MSHPAQFAYHYTARLGWGLVPIPAGQKRPVTPDWQHQPVTDPQQARSVWASGQNMGLLHSASGTCTIDVDHLEYLQLAAAALEFDLLGAIEAAPLKIKGKNGSKPLYRVPEGVTLPFHKLVWPHHTERLENGRPRTVTVIEFRAGPGKQDVLPPSIHPDTQQPYEWIGTPPRSREDIPELPADLLAFWLALGDHLPTLKAACPWGTPDAPQTDTKPRATPFTGESVIDAFNARYTVADILNRNGYKQRGARWLSPNSSTRMAGVTVYTENGKTRAVSHHGSDDWANGHGHDAFGLFTVLEHDGHLGRALETARLEFGLERPAAPTQSPVAADPLALWKAHAGPVCDRLIDVLMNSTGHQKTRQKYMDILIALFSAAHDDDCLKVRRGQAVIEFGGLAALAERILYRGRLHDLRAALDYLNTIGMLGRVVHTNPQDSRSPLAVEVTADPRDLPALRFPGQLALKSTSWTTLKRIAQGSKKQFGHNDIKPGYAIVSKCKNPLHDARYVLYWIRRGAASPQEVARLGKMRLPTVQRHLAQLEQAGLIVDFRPALTPGEERQAIRQEVESDPAYRAARIRYLENALSFGARGSAVARRLNAPRTAARRLATCQRAHDRLTRLMDGESCGAVFGVAA